MRGKTHLEIDGMPLHDVTKSLCSVELSDQTDVVAPLVRTPAQCRGDVCEGCRVGRCSAVDKKRQDLQKHASTRGDIEGGKDGGKDRGVTGGVGSYGCPRGTCCTKCDG